MESVYLKGQQGKLLMGEKKDSFRNIAVHAQIDISLFHKVINFFHLYCMSPTLKLVVHNRYTKANNSEPYIGTMYLL